MGETAHWSDFFVAEVGAAAALSGLVVVAISINLKQILTVSVLPGRAAETLVMLVCAMLICSAGLIPDQPARIFGLETLIFGAIICAVSATTQLRTLSSIKGSPIHWWAVRLLVSAVAALPIVIGGILLYIGRPEGAYWIAGGVMALLAAGVFNSWVLLIEILR
jgi:modulator of FtsH protease